MANEQQNGMQRRRFLKGAAAGGLAAAVAPLTSGAEATPRPEGGTNASCGSDYMVDVVRSLGIEYFAATPGNTFMGLHESVVNYGMTTSPALRFITTMHE